MKRVKLSRQRGSRLPPSTLICARNGRGNGKYGNPFRIEQMYATYWRICISEPTPVQLEILLSEKRGYYSKADAQQAAADCFRQWLETWSEEELSAYLKPLKAYEHLACWCGLESPCHVDVLINFIGRPAGDLPD